MRLHILGIPFRSPGFDDKVSTMRHMFPNAAVHGADPAEWEGPPDFDDLAKWQASNSAAIASLRYQLNPRDIILNMAGIPQRSITDAFPDVLAVEAGIGYRGTCLQHRVWESYAWMHHCQGLSEAAWFNAVIPPAFDPASYHLATKEDYLLFVGRLSEDKGAHIAAQIARAAGLRLVVAGAGGAPPPGCEYVGQIGPAEKARLMAGARALLVPTLYLEPFGRVVVEAQLCGTPVIATDWGAFVETVCPATGVRFRSLAEAVQAVEFVQGLLPEFIRQIAISRYSLAAIKPQWERYFARLSTLWGDGWNAL